MVMSDEYALDILGRDVGESHLARYSIACVDDIDTTSNDESTWRLWTGFFDARSAVCTKQD